MAPVATRWFSPLNGHSIERVSCFTYLGSPITDTGLADELVKVNILKARRCLTRIRPVLRSSNITIQHKTRLIETLVTPVLLYSIETIVLRAKDSDRLEAVKNTARRMILGICDKREANNQELHRRVFLPNVATQVQQRRLNLWYSMKARELNLAVRVLLSEPINSTAYRPAHTKAWMRQLRADIVQVLSIDCNTWIERPTKIRVQDDPGRRPKLIGRRVMTIVCTDVACVRMFATRKKMYRHVRQDHDSAGLTGTVVCRVRNNTVINAIGLRDGSIAILHNATLNYSP